MSVRTGLAAAALVVVVAPAAASAVDRFEIQVYTPEINAPGHLGVELHANFTPSGATQPSYPGEIPLDRLAHFTLEPAVGVTDWLELGGYVQTLAGAMSGARFGGFKLRAKFVVPERAGLPVLLGINCEIGRVPREVEEEGWANEFRPIIGWTDGRFLISLNPIFGSTLTGKDRFRVALEPALKVGWNTGHGYMLGLEYYSALGFADRIAPLRDEEHLLFAVLDLAPARGEKGDWELNAGIGAGLTPGTPQTVVAKAIVGRNF